MRRKETEERRPGLRQRQSKEFKIHKAKATYAISCILLNLESFAFVFSGYRRGVHVLQDFVLVFSSSVWELTSEVVRISKSSKVWESWKRACLGCWLWPVPSAQYPKRGPRDSSANALTQSYTYQVSFQAPLTCFWMQMAVSAKPVQSAMLSGTWAQGYSVCQLLVVLGRQSELRHSTGMPLDAKVPGSSAQGNLASHRTLHTVREGTVNLFIPENRGML